MNTIEEFITRRFGDTDAHWTDGNCFYFAQILKTRFPFLEICYDPVLGHFIAGAMDLNIFYDHKGIYTPIKVVSWAALQSEDPILADRIIRDCLN